MFSRHRGIILLLFIALCVRVGISLYAIGLREHPDLLRWKDWGRIAFLYSFEDTYTPKHLQFGTYPNNMPPFTLYVVSSVYWVWLQLGKVFAHVGIAPGSNAWINVVLLTLLFRLPSVISDLLLGYLIYFMLRSWKQSERLSYIGAGLYLFNPAVLFNSSFWGQMDSITNLPFILSLYFLLQKKTLLSAGAFAMSLLTKFSLIGMMPLYVVLQNMQSPQGKIKRLVGMLVVIVAVTLICTLPISTNPLTWYREFMVRNISGEMDNITAFAFNLWWVIFHPTLAMGPSNDITRVVSIWLEKSPLIQTIYGSFSLGNIALLVSGLVQIPLYAFAVWKLHNTRGVLSPRILFGLTAMLAIILFITLPKMHERYLYPAWAPLAILVGLGVPLIWEIAGLAFLNFINLIIVWHPMPLAPEWFDLMRNPEIQWWVAICTVTLGGWTVYKIMKFTGAYVAKK